MLLEASTFERFIESESESSKIQYPALTYAMNGHAIELRLYDVRTYGGQIRMYNDTEGNPVDTGSTTVPMRVKRPFRLAPQSAYVFYFHIKLKQLPDDVVAHIIPTKRVSEIGVLYTDVYVEQGQLTVTAMPLRMLEVQDGFPMAWLVFSKKENTNKINNIYSDNPDDEADVPAVKKAPKNATNTRTRSK